MMISFGVHLLQIMISLTAIKGTSWELKPSRNEHFNAVSDNQEVPAHPAVPMLALNVISLKPKLVPDRRTSVADSVATPASTLDTLGPSYVNASVKVRLLTPTIDTTTALGLPDDPLMSLHVNAESETHVVAAH